MSFPLAEPSTASISRAYLTVYTPAHLRAVEDKINKRPRLVLADRAPTELFAVLLASPEPPSLRR
jgi:IS30 family transposase